MINIEKKISIITVVYNNKATIKHAIESVLSQSYKNLEFIIIDGKSTDGTFEILSEYSSKNIIIISEKDSGIYDAMNKGLKLATGDVLGILNSDDLYPNNSILSEVMSHFNNDSNLDILYGDLVYVKYNNISNIVRTWTSKPYYFKFFENGNVPPHPSLFLSARVYYQVGYFNLKYTLASDYEFMLRIFKSYNFKTMYIPIVLVYMRLGGATNNSFKNVYQGNMEILNSWKENGFKIPLLFIPKRIFKRLIQFFQ
jgi:glycosyltransferase involved in cell wall biosynthesis